ncbi:hypothetical protein TrST_g4409 [Triparma strigata]|uniref:Uncharacterized protein n=1 Tax=Triparma strigata TaxID=1606541 RepID=A0A9W7AG32_9STRA|nr:hypothetical protein TrST_g4409 [Triparma strigata]
MENICEFMHRQKHIVIEEDDEIEALMHDGVGGVFSGFSVLTCEAPRSAIPLSRMAKDFYKQQRKMLRRSRKHSRRHQRSNSEASITMSDTSTSSDSLASVSSNSSLSSGDDLNSPKAAGSL